MGSRSKKTSKSKSTGIKSNVLNFFSNITDHSKCITNEVLDSKIFVKDRIGTESAYGEVFLGCYLASCKTKLAIKKIAFTEKEYQLRENPFNLKVLNYSPSWAEIYFLKLCGQIVEQGICINLPKYYNYYICNKCNYSNLSISEKIRKQNTCAIVPVELADGDFKTFINSDQQIYKLFCAYFQIFAGIYALQKYLGARHNDLHYGNVLFKKVKKGLFEYIIDGKKYYIENNGLLFYIWDFGMTTVPGTIGSKVSETKESLYEDYDRILSMVIPDKKDHNNKEIATYLYTLINSLIKKSNTPKELILSYLELVSAKSPGSNKVIGSSNLDKHFKSAEVNLLIKK
jgi:hypothetical protein